MVMGASRQVKKASPGLKAVPQVYATHRIFSSIKRQLN
jgi:hypothetical protein